MLRSVRMLMLLSVIPIGGVDVAASAGTSVVRSSIRPLGAGGLELTPVAERGAVARYGGKAARTTTSAPVTLLLLA